MKRAIAVAVLLALASGVYADERMDLRRDALVRAVEKVSPAVVNISTEKIVKRGFFLDDFSPFDDPFLEQFMGQFGRLQKATSLGSGGIFSRDGYIFTNAHVVNRASKIMVTLSDGSQHHAELVNVDVASDLAVIKIETGKALPSLVLGRSDDIMAGERCIAVGNPFGLSSSVTEGVISATRRDIVAEGRVIFRDILQTDALINPGNSGGPLLNIVGEVIGVTSAMRADAQGIGFAIPVDRARKSLAELVDYRKLLRLRTGLELEHRYTGSGLAGRVSVKSVEKGGPAEAAGVKTGDVITMANERDIANVIDFNVAVLVGEGKAVRIKGSRAYEDLAVTITPAAIPKPDGVKLAREMLGLSVQELDSEVARDMGIMRYKGILVSDVRGGSSAGEAGIERGDIIVQVSDTYTGDMDAFASALETASGAGKTYLVFLRREGRALYQFGAEVGLKGSVSY